MTTTSRFPAAARTAQFCLVAIVALPTLHLVKGTAALVRQLGLDSEIAVIIVNTLVSEGSAVVVSVFPFLRPFIGRVFARSRYDRIAGCGVVTPFLAGT